MDEICFIPIHATLQYKALRSHFNIFCINVSSEETKYLLSLHQKFIFCYKKIIWGICLWQCKGLTIQEWSLSTTSMWFCFSNDLWQRPFRLSWLGDSWLLLPITEERTGMLLNSSYCTEQPPPQRLFRVKVSTLRNMSRLRNDGRLEIRLIKSRAMLTFQLILHPETSTLMKQACSFQWRSDSRA